MTHMQAGRDPNDRDRHHDPEMIRTHPIITSPPSQMRIVRISDILGAWRNDSDGTGGDGELRETSCKATIFRQHGDL
jgi:hypothetical protein